MDGLRNFSEGLEPRWYEGERGHGEPGWDARGGEGRFAGGEGRFGDDSYPVPDPRGSRSESRYGGYGDAAEPRFSDERFEADTRRVDPGRGGGEPGGPVLDPGRPPVDYPTRMNPVASLPPAGFPAEPLDRAAVRRTGPAAPVGDGVYRTRRPALAIAFAVLAVIFELPALRLLVSAAFGDKVSGPGVVAGILLVSGLPVFAVGLYALVTSGRAAAQEGAYAWLRPPVGYLAVGLALLLAAALAAG